MSKINNKRKVDEDAPLPSFNNKIKKSIEIKRNNGPITEGPVLNNTEKNIIKSMNEEPKELCKACYRELVERTVIKDGANKGRRFKTCPAARDECLNGTFNWIDPPLIASVSNPSVDTISELRETLDRNQNTIMESFTNVYKFINEIDVSSNEFEQIIKTKLEEIENDMN